jgi:hypothetical protein
MGYHQTEIKKGKLGEFSKIEEEFMELKDAHQQGVKVLQICELCDLTGAIEAYAEKFGLGLQDLIDMKELTKQSFLEGKR